MMDSACDEVGTLTQGINYKKKKKRNCIITTLVRGVLAKGRGIGLSYDITQYLGLPMLGFSLFKNLGSISGEEGMLV